jgi:hypothetical protein
MVENIYWEIPSSVDLEGFLKKHPPPFKYKIDHFYYIIDYISRGMEREDLDDNGGFVNINAAQLQKANHNYKLYLDHLLKHHFLRTDMKYIVGKKSFGFLINLYKSHQATTQNIEITDWTIRRNKIAEYKASQEQLKQTTKSYPLLTKWFNEKLQIDVQGAEQEVEQLFPEQKGAIRGTRKGKSGIWNKRYKAMYSIHKFAKQEFYYGVDDNVGRFHTNLTNIKKELRNYITYNGEKLVNIDIKNSQPLFSTLLLDKTFWNKKGKLISIINTPLQPSPPTSINITSSNPSSSNPYSFSITIIMIVELLESIDNKVFNQYKSFVNSGKFYEKVSKLLYPNSAFNKQKVKEMVYTVFFSSNRFIGQPGAKPKRDFKLNFPEVYEVFRLIKVKDHTLLARLLQRIESTIMIQHAAKRIAEEKPSLPIFTIHDSIATTTGNEDYVESVIMEEVLKLTGLKVKLGKEYWR